MITTDKIIDEKKIHNVLVEGTYLEEADIMKAEAHAREAKISFPDALLALGLLSEPLLGRAIAESLGLPYAEADMMPTSREDVGHIPEPVARSQHAVYIGTDEEHPVVASSRPTLRLSHVLEELFPGTAVEIRYALPTAIDTAIKLYEKPLDAQFAELFKTAETSIPDILATVLNHAIDLNVSDIHFEPRADIVVVRFRIDGTLLKAAEIPLRFYENILNRIKVLARIPIDEHARAQDGSFQHAHSNGEVNIRVSVTPTIEGEKVALRLLAAYLNAFTVESLGVAEEDRAKLLAASDKPFGMVLVTGPTGSGKTTTLYAILSKLNTMEVNITTIEDPVEYRIKGINQIQTNIATNLTFASGLRSIVRQDPDIVLVGEIRDLETAEIAVNAALTGHLLFSTFHSNDSSTAIPRLLDVGIEPFLLASTLELIVAQRLVRRICDVCRATYTLTAEEVIRTLPQMAKILNVKDKITLYRGKGCAACHGTGYRGRVGIFEIIQNTPALQELITRRPARADIWTLAKSEGTRSLFDDGLAKVREGVTTLEELLRVAEPA